jgi:hypothetical protein
MAFSAIPVIGPIIASVLLACGPFLGWIPGVIGPLLGLAF